MKEWNEVQGRIWDCELCCEHERIACTIRQQTEAPKRSVKLMLIGVAPPYVSGVKAKSVAKSATNDDDDNLRKLFVVATLGLSWADLLDRGLFLVHAVKCAIVPKDRHQNPPDKVVDACAPLYLAGELKLTMPDRIVAFEKEMVPGTVSSRLAPGSRREVGCEKEMVPGTVSSRLAPGSRREVGWR